MNIGSFHPNDRPVSAKKIFSTTEGSVTALQIKSGGQLKEHITSVPALLLCISGNAVFRNKNGVTETLNSGDIVIIEPNVKHIVDANSDTQFVLIK